MTDKTRRYTSIFVNDGQNRLMTQLLLSRQTKPIDRQINIVHDRQNRLNFQPLLSKTDKTG